ncbi:MAG: hypothetical protein KDD70_01325 [Bdellovibrionales bacterium]|nr:hypothetical protein [Bdellovibrionales bacterium]
MLDSAAAYAAWISLGFDSPTALTLKGCAVANELLELVDDIGSPEKPLPIEPIRPAPSLAKQLHDITLMFNSGRAHEVDREHLRKVTAQVVEDGINSAPPELLGPFCKVMIHADEPIAEFQKSLKILFAQSIKRILDSVEEPSPNYTAEDYKHALNLAPLAYSILAGEMFKDRDFDGGLKLAEAAWSLADHAETTYGSSTHLLKARLGMLRLAAYSGCRELYLPWSEHIGLSNLVYFSKEAPTVCGWKEALMSAADHEARLGFRDQGVRLLELALNGECDKSQEHDYVITHLLALENIGPILSPLGETDFENPSPEVQINRIIALSRFFLAGNEFIDFVPGYILSASKLQAKRIEPLLQFGQQLVIELSPPSSAPNGPDFEWANRLVNPRELFDRVSKAFTKVPGPVEPNTAATYEYEMRRINNFELSTVPMRQADFAEKVLNVQRGLTTFITAARQVGMKSLLELSRQHQPAEKSDMLYSKAKQEASSFLRGLTQRLLLEQQMEAIGAEVSVESIAEILRIRTEQVNLLFPK